jgi:hypothetical protein
MLPQAVIRLRKLARNPWFLVTLQSQYADPPNSGISTTEHPRP